MGAFAQRLRKARELSVTVGGLTFVLRRPTDVEMIRVSQDPSPERWMGFIVDWKNAVGTAPSEIELGNPNGEPHPVPFSKEDVEEFVADNAAIYSKIVSALVDAYEAHVASMGEAVKN